MEIQNFELAVSAILDLELYKLIGMWGLFVLFVLTSYFSTLKRR